MIYPRIPLAQSILYIFKTKAIRHIVIAPGSRNAPLTIGFANDPFFTCYSIADERCAAFFAMGIAQQIHQPVAVVCTSGSAVLNFYPAFAEAYYSQIPLIVLSADRPIAKIDIGDGQTIRQRNVFSNHSLYDANLTEEAGEQNDLEINKAVNIAATQKGPVHINAPFEEPLYETVAELAVRPVVTDAEPVQHERVDETSKAVWRRTKKKLIIVGTNDPQTIDRHIIEKFADDPSVVVMTEVTSNFHHPDFVSTIDTLITPFGHADFEVLQPELLVTFGGMIVSKRLKAFLRQYKPEQHWHVDPYRAYDTFNCLTKHHKMEAQEFFKALVDTKATESDYAATVESIQKVRLLNHQKYIKSAPYSDFLVFNQIMKRIPNDVLLHISNSASIRYAQLFGVNPTVEVFCNRGTSGIDGSTSTAIGAAVGAEKATVLITGDVGFFYDSNALWNNHVPRDFKIILVNNGGGGIFRILPGHSENVVFNTFFETSHQLTAEHLAKMFSFHYLTARDEATLNQGLDDLYRFSEGPAILEIFTPTKRNDKVLLDYFKALK